MKIDAKTQQARHTKIREAVKILMEYGLPDPVSTFLRGMNPDREIDVHNIGIPISQPGRLNPGIDLSAMDPAKIVLAMFKHAWEAGFEAGVEQAEMSHAEAMFEAFPKLKDTIREIADEVATKQIDEFRERFSG
jgi:hypothetical protein